MRCCTAFVAPGVLFAELDAVTESLTLVASQWVGDVNTYIVSDVASEQSGGQRGSLKSQNEEAGVTSLSVSERCQTTNMRYTFRSEAVEYLLLRHVPHFRSEDGPLCRVPGMVQRNGYFFLAELCTLEKFFGLSASFGFDHQ